MNVADVLANPAILEAAWLRVRTWYHKGEWVPQPEFARWELHSDDLLEELGQALASRSYVPTPMLLLPHAKKKGRLRHYCQPTVRDQVAFAVFGVLLAPLLEEQMHSFSFGNRWYRGLKREDEEHTSLWSPRNWSLADRDFYQPYRRAHGLFRRAASWTVDSMLGCDSPKESALGPMADPGDFGNDLLPMFAKKSYWQSFPKTDRVFFARFDLKLAYPSVRIDTLRNALNSMVVELLPVSVPGTIDLSSVFLSDNLRLFDASIRQCVTERANVESLVGYLCDLLAMVRYVPFHDSDGLFFPDDPKSPNPVLLPIGEGAEHPGLPTGLAVSGLLMNAYLHSIDAAMAAWFSPCQWPEPTPGQPAAFLRFVDDMVLLAASPTVLTDGIGRLMAAVESQSNASDLNLRMNWDKAQPESVASLLTQYRKPSKRTASKRPTATLTEWTQRNKSGQSCLSKLERDVITEETRGPFVTELVERLSDLGTEKQIDLLPEQAMVRLARLQEIVLFKPDDSVVPRETQLVFAANHLVRAWLPEEDRQKDASLLTEIRRSVAEALRSASDKPRLWRAVWRIAVRRPITSEEADEEQLNREDDAAKKWLLSIVGKFAESASAERFLPPGVESEKDSTHWQRVWPMFSSFQRAAIWRAFASVMRDVQYNAKRLSDERAFAPPHSWLFRSADEQTLHRMVSWLPEMAAECLTVLYERSDAPLPTWESESLAVALMAFIPRSAVIHNSPKPSRGFAMIVGELVRKHCPDWAPISVRLQSSNASNIVSSLNEMLTLANDAGKDDANAIQALVRTISSPQELLQILTAIHWREPAEKEVERVARQVLDEHPQRLIAARDQGPAALRRELNRYYLARKSWLATGGNTR